MKHLHPVWWSTFRFMFLNDSWCVNFIWWKRVFYWFLAIIVVFIQSPSFTYHVSFHMTLLWNSFFYAKYLVLLFSIDTVFTLYYGCVAMSTKIRFRFLFPTSPETAFGGQIVWLLNSKIKFGNRNIIHIANYLYSMSNTIIDDDSVIDNKTVRLWKSSLLAQDKLLPSLFITVTGSNPHSWARVSLTSRVMILCINMHVQWNVAVNIWNLNHHQCIFNRRACDRLLSYS